jgi:hypothetical protein
MGQSAHSQRLSPTLANLEKLPRLDKRNPSGPKIRCHFFPRTRGSFTDKLFFPVILMSNYCQDFFANSNIS